MTRSAPHPWHGGEPGAGVPVVVVGVEPGQPPHVVREAARLADACGGALLCVWSDPSRSLVAEEPDGALLTVPMDPDAVDDDDGAVVPAEDRLAAALAAALSDHGGPWRFVYTLGEASHALAREAESHSALMIVVGGRRSGPGGWVHRWVGGSVAGRLAHTQRVPVTVVPPLPDARG